MVVNNQYSNINYIIALLPLCVNVSSSKLVNNYIFLTSSRVEKDSEIARDGRIIAVALEILAEACSAPPLHAGTKKVVRNE